MLTGSTPPAHPGDSPSALWLALELPRAFCEMWEFVAAGPALHLAPRGDGRPVLLLPGFLADDDSTAALRQYLRQLGHSVHPWELGTNLGPTEAILNGLERRIDELSSSGRPIGLVGVSLGGLFARHLARHLPESVDRVITLGSPFRIAKKSQSCVAATYDALSHMHVSPRRFSVWDGSLRQPLPVPSTAIYSRTDGVVAWQACLDECTGRAENIEVVGSHSGLAHLPSAVYAVADRLAQPGASWRKFVPPPLLRHLYPAPGAIPAA